MKIFRSPSSGNIREVYLPVAAVAVVLRAVAFGFWLDSPLRWFHRVPGLDMMTLLEFGEWGVLHPPLFTLHRTLVASIWSLNGQLHAPEVLVALQMAGGVAVALITSWCALHLTGRRRLAAGCGILAALYAPALLYECTTLQESVVTLALWISFAGVLAARRRRFAPGAGFTAGILLGLAAIGRPTALLWTVGATAWCGWRGRRRSPCGGFPGGWRSFLPVAGGVLALWLLVAGLNWYGRSSFTPFFNVLPYAAEVNRSPVGGEGAAVSAGAPVPAESRLALLWRIGWNAVGRLPVLFTPREVPDNLNYYFIRREFPPLAPLPGPEPVLVLALAGIGLMLFSGRFRRGEGMFLLVTLLLALPLCANYPMGRYRLILYPALCFFAVWPWCWSLGGKRSGRIFRVSVMLAAVALASIPWWMTLREPRLRGSDLVAWALASEQPAGEPTAESMALFEQAFREGGNRAAFSNLMDRLVRLHRIDLADRLVDEALERGRPERSLPLLYRGIFRLAEGRPAEAAEALSACDESELGGETWRLAYLRGEAARRLARPAEAAEWFRLALAEAPESDRPRVEAALKEVSRR